MTREMAAVVLTCGNAENEMHYLLGQPLEIKAIDMTTPAGRIAISEKEARRLMDQAIADGEIFKEKGIERVLALLSVRGSLIKYIEEPTPIMQIYAVNDMPESIYNIENPVKEAFFLYALTQSYSAPQMGYGSMIDERFRMLSEEEIIEVLKINPGAMCAVPTEQITPDLVFEFINAVWEQKKRFLMGAFRNIPDSMKDYMYYVIMVMSHGYNLSLIPKEERELYITEEVIQKVLSEPDNFSSAIWLYEYLPEHWKTADISEKFIAVHFGCVRYLPKVLKNDTFYSRLVKSSPGNLEAWFSQIDAKTISKELFQQIVVENHLTEIPEKVPSDYFNEDVYACLAVNRNYKLPNKNYSAAFYEKLAEYGAVERIPLEKLTQDMVEKAARSKKVDIKQIPEQFRTKELKEIVISEGLYYCSMSLPEEWRSKETVMHDLKEGRPVVFEDIPKGIIDEELIAAVVFERPEMLVEIPEERQTDRICRIALNQSESNRKEWFWILEHCVYRSREDMEYALEHEPRAIYLKGLTREQIDESLKAFPLNILSVPAWYLEEDEKYEELSIFDFMEGKTC